IATWRTQGLLAGGQSATTALTGGYQAAFLVSAALVAAAFVVAAPMLRPGAAAAAPAPGRPDVEGEAGAPSAAAGPPPPPGGGARCMRAWSRSGRWARTRPGIPLLAGVAGARARHHHGLDHADVVEVERVRDRRHRSVRLALTRVDELVVLRHQPARAGAGE